MYSGANVIDWDTDTIKCALVKSGYTPNQDTHAFFSSITEELTTANGYTAGGNTLVCSAPSYDEATNEMRLIATATFWTASGGSLTARYGIVYKSTGVAGTSPLIAYIDFGENNTAGAGSKFEIAFDATGVAKIVAA
jgi:hypothetical protein